jgi:hypothetical protein
MKGVYPDVWLLDVVEGKDLKREKERQEGQEGKER